MVYLRGRNPTLEFALDSMRFFALGGVQFLSEQDIMDVFLEADMVKEYRDSFASDQIAVEEALARDQLENGGGQFLPLPAMNKKMKTGDLLAFFRPRLFRKSGALGEFRIELILIWPRCNESAAFRFERGFREKELHGYSHMQISRSFKGGGAGFVGTSLPKTLGDWSPATPIPAIRYSTWFSMLLSLSGQQREDDNGLLRVFDDLGEFTDQENHKEARNALFRITKILLNGEQFYPGIAYSSARNPRLS